MSGPATTRRPRPRTVPGRAGRLRERGGASWVSLLLLVALVGGGYLAWVWAPLYFEYLEVKHVVLDHMNQAIKDRDDDRIRARMVSRIQALREVVEVDQLGREVKVPAISLDERAIEWERDTEAKSLHVSFTYERPFVYPLLDRPAVAVFAIDRTNDLTPPKW